MSRMLTPKSLPGAVARVLERTPFVDIHTHLFDPAIGGLLLWGIDELVTYHYLVAELFRARPDLEYDAYWAMPKTAQADLIWRELFVERTPISEACRGVLTVLDRLGLDPNARDLKAARRYFAKRTARGYVDQVFELANISAAYMTNDPLDPQEAPAWVKGFRRDPRFLGALRLDSAVMAWPAPVPKLRSLGYDVDATLSGRTMGELQRYLNEWCDRIEARYVAISLPPTFRYPDLDSTVTTLLTKAVFPVARARGIPAALMIGVKKLTNPKLVLAGDSVGPSDVGTVERLALDFADNRFLITMLARENTHELCVAARKFKNITPFGCWWFLNNPSLIREMTAMRLELLGLSFIPQHSDCRILDQMIYKWSHSRAIIGEVLGGKYRDLLATGRRVTEDDIRRDVRALLQARP